MSPLARYSDAAPCEVKAPAAPLPAATPYTVEARTQFATHRRENAWHVFGTFTARTKGDAIRQARAEARRGDCYAGLGLVWWRAR